MLDLRQVTGTLGLGLAILAASCTHGETPKLPTCITADDCDMATDTRGQLCIDGACEPCSSYSECRQTARYGQESICTDGRCGGGACSDGAVGCACSNSIPCASGLLCDESTQECREPEDCIVVACALHQLCESPGPGQDAECVPSCESGYTWNATTNACESVPLNCIDGDPASIKAQCDSVHRLCEQSGGSASCGACVSGYAETSGACVEIAGCTALGCTAQRHRACAVNGEGVGECTNCLSGYIEVDGSEVCRPLYTCATLPVGCTASETCIEGSATRDAYCMPRGGYCASPPPCPAGWAFDPKGKCEPCSVTCNAADPSQTGELYPVLSQQGDCICVTRDGYFYDEQADSNQKCDADEDGWVRASARASYHGSDCALRANARCKLRVIDRFVMHSDEGFAFPPVLIADDAYVNTLAEVVALGGKLELFETDLNDSFELRVTADEPPLPVYANGEATPANSRQVVPAEVNSLTKACAAQSPDLAVDYNHNQIPDVREWHGMQTYNAHTEEWQKPFVHYSYFMELFDGWYEGPAGGAGVGEYHIREKSRTGTNPGANSLPVGYLVTDGLATQGQQCLRRRDSTYSVNGALPNTGMDFERFVNADGHTFGHSSQYKCVSVVSSYPANPRSEGVLVTPADASNYRLNSCTIVSEAGKTRPGPAGDEGNPIDPVFTCAASDDSPSTMVGSFALAAAMYTNYTSSSGYLRGCINECVDQAMMRAADWCIGYDPNPALANSMYSCGWSSSTGEKFCKCGICYTGTVASGCTPTTAGTDPFAECPGSVGCDGTGGCGGLENGTVCTSGTECSTGFCPGNVCCDAPCTDGCHTCNAALMAPGGVSGTCSMVAVGKDPLGFCDSVSGCDGRGSCLPMIWGSETPISSDCNSPVVAMNESGQGILAWRAEPEGTMLPSYHKVWASMFTPESGWSQPALVADTAYILGIRTGIAPDGSAVVFFDRTYLGDGTSVYSPGNGWSSVESLTFEDVAAMGPGQFVGVTLEGGNVAVREYAAGSGWQSPVTVATYPQYYGADSVLLAASSSGQALLLWLRSAALEKGQLYVSRRLSASSWTEPLNIGVGVDSLATAVVNTGGYGLVSWKKGTQVTAMAYSPSAGWGSASPLAGSTKSAIDAAGNVTVAWASANVLYGRRYSPGTGWSNEDQLDLCQGYLCTVSPSSLVANSVGTVGFAWKLANSPRASVFESGTGWEAYDTLADTTTAFSSVSMGIDGIGRMIAAWSTYQNTCSIVRRE